MTPPNYIVRINLHLDPSIGQQQLTFELYLIHFSLFIHSVTFKNIIFYCSIYINKRHHSVGKGNILAG
jgi:hypothetical protein